MPTSPRKPWATIAAAVLLVACQAYFELRWASGRLTVADLLRLGGLHAPMHWSDAWRLATSQLLHWDVAHAACTLLLLLGAGPFVERECGPLRMLLVFFAAGILGSAGDAYADQMWFTLGATSGALGLVGALVAVTALAGRGARAWQRLWPAGVALLAAMTIALWAYGGTLPRTVGLGPIAVDLRTGRWVTAYQAHVVGITAGLLLAVALRRSMLVGTAAAAIAILLGTWLAVHESDRTRHAMARNWELARQSVAILFDVRTYVATDRATPSIAAAGLRRDVLAPWRQHVDWLNAEGAPAELIGYADNIGAAFELFVTGIEANDQGKVDRAVDDLVDLGVAQAPSRTPWVRALIACEREEMEACERLQAMFEGHCTPDEKFACAPLAAALQHLGKPDEARAIAEHGVELGDAASHATLASMHLSGVGGLPNPARARELVLSGCALDHGPSCGIAAMLLRGGFGGPADPAEADRLAKRGCDLGDGTSCKQLLSDQPPAQ